MQASKVVSAGEQGSIVSVLHEVGEPLVIAGISLCVGIASLLLYKSGKSESSNLDPQQIRFRLYPFLFLPVGIGGVALGFVLLIAIAYKVLTA